MLYYRGKTGNREKENVNEIMSTHKVIRLSSCPKSHITQKPHFQGCVQAEISVLFHFHCVASASALDHFHCLFLPRAASLPHFCPSLLPPFILRDSGQGLLQFPLLMASPCYCSQTSAVSLLVPESGTYFSFLKQQSKLTREGNEGILEGHWRNVAS